MIAFLALHALALVVALATSYAIVARWAIANVMILTGRHPDGSSMNFFAIFACFLLSIGTWAAVAPPALIIVFLSFIVGWAAAIGVTVFRKQLSGNDAMIAELRAQGAHYGPVPREYEV